MAVTFLSTYQTVTTIWRGPAVAYLLNLAAGNYTGLLYLSRDVPFH